MLLLSATVVSLMAATGCSSSTSGSTSAAGAADTTAAASEKVLRVVMECAYAPFNWTQTDDSNGAVPIANSEGAYCNGYDVQMAVKIASDLGYKLEIYKTEWTSIPTAITSGKADVGICGMTVSEERKQTLLFSDPYYIADYVALVKGDGKYANATSLADFDGVKCTSQQSTSWYEFLSQIPNADIQPALADVPSMIVALNSGKVDLLDCDYPTALAAVATNPDLKIIQFEKGKGFQFEEERTHVCACMALDNTALQGEINGVLSGITQADRDKMMDDAIANQPS